MDNAENKEIIKDDVVKTPAKRGRKPKTETITKKAESVKKTGTAKKTQKTNKTNKVNKPLKMSTSTYIESLALNLSKAEINAFEKYAQELKISEKELLALAIKGVKKIPFKTKTIIEIQ